MSTKIPVQSAVASAVIEPLIHDMRGVRVVLAADLAIIYEVSVKRLNEQVKRNRERFPADFMFQLSFEEADAIERLRSQIATSNTGRGGRRYLPYAFTEHGAMMAATILNSPRAVEMSVFVVRAFIRMREMLGKHKEIDARLEQLERKTAGHDSQIHGIIDALRKLMAPAAVVKRPMGFQPVESKGPKGKKRIS